MNVPLHEAFEIKVSEQVKDFLEKKFNRQLAEEFYARIQKLKIAPETYGKPLKGKLAGAWEIRFEKRWRILYGIDKQNKLVTITGIKHKDEF